MNIEYKICNECTHGHGLTSFFGGGGGGRSGGEGIRHKKLHCSASALSEIGEKVQIPTEDIISELKFEN